MSTWFEEGKERLTKESEHPDNIPFERLRVLGLIDDRGEVTGHVRRWDAYLAVIEVKRIANRQQIATFRCLKPVFGMPGSATIDVSRDSMVDYLKKQKKIVTARWDDRLNMWREGCLLQLSRHEFVRCDSGDDCEDNVGALPEFQQTDSRL